MRPLAQPEHCFAAAAAEDASSGMMAADVKGASCVVAARPRARNDLNVSWSVSQDVRLYSHQISVAMEEGKYMFMVALRRRAVRLAQVVEPFVWKGGGEVS